MEIKLVGLHVPKLFVNCLKVTQPRVQLPSLQKRFPSLNDVPMVLQLVRVRLIPHEQPHHVLGNLRLSAPEQVLHTNIVHVPVRKICLPRLVYCLQRLNVIVHLVLNLRLYNVKL